MGLLSTLARRLRSLLGQESDDRNDEVESESPDAPAYRCAICGTGVGSPDDSCPLCGSTDVVAGTPEEEGAAEKSPSDLDPDNVTRTSVPDGSAPEDRLRELARERGDPLRDHPDRWERLQDRGQYAVELPGGETRYVGSRDEVRAALREYFE